MGMNVMQWGLATESEYGLHRIGQFVFTREKAERLRDDWNRINPGNPVFVVNLKSE
jgi:hypothetical protein